MSVGNVSGNLLAVSVPEKPQPPVRSNENIFSMLSHEKAPISSKILEFLGLDDVERYRNFKGLAEASHKAREWVSDRYEGDFHLRKRETYSRYVKAKLAFERIVKDIEEPRQKLINQIREDLAQRRQTWRGWIVSKLYPDNGIVSLIGKIFLCFRCIRQEIEEQRILTGRIVQIEQDIRQLRQETQQKFKEEQAGFNTHTRQTRVWLPMVKMFGGWKQFEELAIKVDDCNDLLSFRLSKIPISRGSRFLWADINRVNAIGQRQFVEFRFERGLPEAYGRYRIKSKHPGGHEVQVITLYLDTDENHAHCWKYLAGGVQQAFIQDAHRLEPIIPDNFIHNHFVKMCRRVVRHVQTLKNREKIRPQTNGENSAQSNTQSDEKSVAASKSSVPALLPIHLTHETNEMTKIFGDIYKSLEIPGTFPSQHPQLLSAIEDRGIAALREFCALLTRVAIESPKNEYHFIRDSNVVGECFAIVQRNPTGLCELVYLAHFTHFENLPGVTTSILNPVDFQCHQPTTPEGVLKFKIFAAKLKDHLEVHKKPLSEMNPIPNQLMKFLL